MIWPVSDEFTVYLWELNKNKVGNNLLTFLCYNGFRVRFQDTEGSLKFRECQYGGLQEV